MSVSTDASRHPELLPVRAVLFDFAETLFMPEEERLRIRAGLDRLGEERLSQPEIDRLAGLIQEAFGSKDYLMLRDRMDLSAAEHRAAFMAAFAAAEARVEGLGQAMYDRLRTPDSWVPS